MRAKRIFETPAERRARAFHEGEQRKVTERQRVADDATERSSGNLEARAITAVAHSISRLGGAHWEGTAEPGQIGFERDGWEAQPVDPKDIEAQRDVRILFNQSLGQR